MDRYITITSSDQDPCNFTSNFTNSININDGYEIAMTNIYHAPLYNITEDNNKFTLVRDNAVSNFHIPAGFYESRCEVLGAIQKVLNKAVEGDLIPSHEILISRKPIFKYVSGDSSTLTFDKNADADIYFLIDNARDQDSLLLKVLGYCVDGRIKKLEISHTQIDNTCEVGFLYSSIVANSIIDQKQSRLLACIPIYSKSGYNHYEFKNPIYNPLSVHSFTDIEFVLTDVTGNVMQMDHLHTADWGYNKVALPTIITLHIRKIRKKQLL